MVLTGFTFLRIVMWWAHVDTVMNLLCQNTQEVS